MDRGFVAHPLVVATLAFAAAAALGGPVVLAWWWRRRSGAPWSAFGWGMLVFFVSQCVLRLPWQIPLGIALAPRLRGSVALSAAWIFVSALTAAVWEECGRWAGYKWLVKRERTFRVGVMYGLGHGGIEAILLAGLSLAGTLVVYVLLAAHVPLALPAEARAKLVAALSALGPTDGLAVGAERAMATTCHVAMSLVVLQVFVRGSRAWLLLAILFHFLVDFTSVAGAAALKEHGPLVRELAVLPSAIAAAWIIARLRAHARRRIEANSALG